MSSIQQEILIIRADVLKEREQVVSRWARGLGWMWKNVLFCFEFSTRDWTHILAHASQVLCHWAAAPVQEVWLSSGMKKGKTQKGHCRNSRGQGRVWEALTLSTRDWSLQSHYTQWGQQLQLWAGIKTGREPAEEFSIPFLSAGNSSLPTFNPRAELQYFTEYLRVKVKHNTG